MIDTAQFETRLGRQQLFMGVRGARVLKVEHLSDGAELAADTDFTADEAAGTISLATRIKPGFVLVTFEHDGPDPRAALQDATRVRRAAALATLTEAAAREPAFLAVLELVDPSIAQEVRDAPAEVTDQ